MDTSEQRWSKRKSFVFITAVSCALWATIVFGAMSYFDRTSAERNNPIASIR